MHSLRLIAQHLDRVSPEDIAARERLALAAVLCGRGTEQSGGGLATVLAHAIGHRSKVANGIVNAIVLPHTMRFKAPVTAQGSARIAEALRLGSANADSQQIDLLESLLAKLPIPRRLQDIGVAEQDLAHIAHAAMADWFISRNPRRVSAEAEVLGILKSAW